MNAELRVAIDEQVDVIRHDFLVEDYRIPFPAYLGEDRLEPVIHAGDQHLPAVLRAPDDVEFAVKGTWLLLRTQSYIGDAVIMFKPRNPDFVQGAYPPQP